MKLLRRRCQENFHKEEDKLIMLRTAIEVNFGELSAAILEPTYMRWRRDKPDLLQALFEVCDLLQPFTIKAINVGKPSRGKGYKKFFCSTCKANDDHATKDCPKKVPNKMCTVCKATDHNATNCPKSKVSVCPICKKKGHTQEDCWSVKGVVKEATATGVPNKEAAGASKIGGNNTVRPKKEENKLPPGYVCNKCGVSGHWNSQCPGKI